VGRRLAGLDVIVLLQPSPARRLSSNSGHLGHLGEGPFALAGSCRGKPGALRASVRPGLVSVAASNPTAICSQEPVRGTGAFAQAFRPPRRGSMLKVNNATVAGRVHPVMETFGRGLVRRRVVVLPRCLGLRRCISACMRARRLRVATPIGGVGLG